MKISHYWNLFVLLVSLTQLAKGQVVLALEGTSCQGQSVTLGCIISSFTTNAEWKRGDGLVLAITCSSGNLCSQVSQPIDGTTYAFSGNTSGIYMSTTLPASEHGINWTCTYNGNEYIYSFELGCSEVTTEGSTEGGGSDDSNNTTVIVVVVSCTLLLCIGLLLLIFLYRKFRGPLIEIKPPIEIRHLSHDHVKITWKRPRKVTKDQIKYHIYTNKTNTDTDTWKLLEHNVVDESYTVKMSGLSGPVVFFRVVAEHKNVSSKPLTSHEYLLTGDTYKPRPPLEVKRGDEQYVLTWHQPHEDSDQFKYRIDELLKDSDVWNTIEEDVVELTCNVSISFDRSSGVLFRVIAQLNNGFSKPLVADDFI